MEDMPIGFLMALSENYDAMTRFSSMPDAQRTQLVDRARYVSSKAEMHRLVSGITGMQ